MGNLDGKTAPATAYGGRVIVIGGLSGFGGARIEPGVLIGGPRTLAGVSVGGRASTEDLVRFIETKEIKPTIDRSFAFDDALSAYRHLEAGRAFGKVVVEIS